VESCLDGLFEILNGCVVYGRGSRLVKKAVVPQPPNWYFLEPTNSYD
jgi:hypothetical protein